MGTRNDPNNPDEQWETSVVKEQPAAGNNVDGKSEWEPLELHL